MIGADKAIRADLWWMAAIALGIVTAVGGGVLRDVLTDSIPAVLKPGGLYAIAAFAGSATFVLMVMWLPVTKPFALAVAALLAFGLRVGSLALGWRSPEPFDLTPMMAHVPAASRQACAGCRSSGASWDERLLPSPATRTPPMSGRSSWPTTASPSVRIARAC